MKLTNKELEVIKEVLYDFLDENDYREDVRDILINLQTKYE